MIDPHDVLHCPMDPGNDARAKTVGEFLGVLLCTLWEENEQFSGKRPLGNSDWQWQVYEAMVKNGLIAGILYEGHLEDFSYEEEEKADDLILQAIKLAYDHS